MTRVRFSCALILGAMLAFGTAVRTAAQDSPEAQAQAILKQARDAAGGDAKLKAVQSLNFSGKSKRVTRMMIGGGSGGAQPAPMIQESDFEVDVLAPDKYVRKDTREIMNGQATIISHRGFNGETPIQRIETIGDAPNFQQQQQRPDPVAAVRNAKQEFLRSWLGWALEPPAGFGVTYRSAGAEDVNNTKYNVVEATAPDNFSAKLYFDAATHRLGMIRYKAPGMQMMRMSGSPPGATPPADGQPTQQVFTRQGPAGGGAPGPETEIEIAFSDYKAVDGIQLPHKIRRTSNGEMVEETELKRFRINPNLKADKFKTTD